MKKNFFYTLLFALFASGTVQAQCPVNENCSEVNLDFQTSGNGADISHLENWSYSHGSPSVSSTGFWLWSYNNNGEGINYSGYNFQAGRQYTICFVANTETHDGSPANANATFNIVGSNGPVVGTLTTSGGAAIPAVPSPSQTVVSEPWSTFPNPGTGTYTYTFTATGNWTNLWFYPSSATLPQVEISISSIVICEIEPCDANFTLQLGDAGGGMTSVSAILTNPNHAITYMEILQNGSTMYSGPPVSALLPAGNGYMICIVAVNKNTGEECRKCFDFCIGEGWIGQDGQGGADLDGDSRTKSKQSVVVGENKSVISEKYKDKPSDKVLAPTITPNPSNGTFEVLSSSKKSLMSSIEVYDMNLKLVHTVNSIQGQNRASIDLNDQQSGIYLVKVIYANGSVEQQKVIVEK